MEENSNNKQRKKKKINKMAVSLFCILVSAYTYYMTFTNYHKIKSMTTDVSNYLQYEDPLYFYADDFERPVVFPQKLKESYKVNYYFYADVFQRFNRLGQHFFIDISYNEEDYALEIERLQKWERSYIKEDEQKTKQLLFDQQHFEFPAYVASYNYQGNYEYALIVESSRIIYVYINSLIEDSLSKNPISPLDKKYLPNDYYEKDWLDTDSAYCVYMNN